MTPTFKFAVREDLKDSEFNFLPTKSDEGAACYDVRCAEPEGVIVKPGEYCKIRLGFRMFAPPDYWLEVRPRSSSFAKKYLHSLYGVIDFNFENELLWLAKYDPGFPNKHMNLKIEFGEKIAQVRPVKLQEMVVEGVSGEEYDRLCKERNGTRGLGGFGSTGDK